MDKWEYKTFWYNLDYSDELKLKLNKLGESGWEFVSIYNDYTFILKRKI
jgi:hypothetical protein